MIMHTSHDRDIQHTCYDYQYLVYEWLTRKYYCPMLCANVIRIWMDCNGHQTIKHAKETGLASFRIERH